MKFNLVFLLVFNALLFPFGFNLPQENPEELFLTDKSYSELERMKKEFGRQDLVFVSRLSDQISDEVSIAVEKSGAEFSALTPLLPGHGVIEIPPMPDARRYEFLKNLSEKFPSLTFAGEAYTNSQLAGMSLRIQQVLFPLVFAVIFLGLLILTRNGPVSGFLFLSSLLGTHIGLLIIRILYGHTTILTNLTPLIAFILTLGVQLHVVYGLNLFKATKEFYNHKIRPILMMMATTVLGFLSLVSSDLPSIRQLAITSSVSLTITWAILLLLLKQKPPEISIPQPFWHRREWKPRGSNPLAGFLILLALTTGGMIAITRMPILVEAIEFFDKEHPVQTGHHDISKGLGGTPHFDLIVSRKDNTSLTFTDLQKLEEFQDQLIKAFPETRVLSLIQLVKFINLKYSQSDTLPDNEPAFQMLAGRIPSVLRNHLANENVQRISLTSKLLSVEERHSVEKKLESLILKLDPEYEARIGGLTHLLLQSQTGLVTSLIKSFLISFLMITAIFGFFSRDLRSTTIFAFLNMASIMGGLFCMWMLGFTLNVSSVMTVSISMGLVVDSTIHLMHAKRKGEKNEEVYHSTVVPITLSHILLFVAFAGLAFISFVPIHDFSLGLIILLLIGLFCDLFVLPMVSDD